jgi:hypothetical protein
MVARIVRTLPDVALLADKVTKVIDAGSTRSAICVQNLGSSAIRVGDDSISANQGGQIAPGENGAFLCNAAIYAFSPGAPGLVAILSLEE